VLGVVGLGDAEYKWETYRQLYVIQPEGPTICMHDLIG